MKKNITSLRSSFLMNSENELEQSSFLKLSLYLNTPNYASKPYAIDFNTLLMSYHSWKGSDIEEFCEKHTISYFLLNPQNDSAEAREALYLDIREFLMGN